MLQTPPADQTAAQPAPGAAEPVESGYKIIIAVDGQGKISVGVENEAAPAAPADATGAPVEDEVAEMGAMKPARDIKDALTQALEIFKNDGESAQSSADADFQSGFGGPATSGDMQ